MIALGIDTSNYATSMAVVNTARMEVVCAMKQFLPVAQGQCGLRQSDAVFHHTTALPIMFEQMEESGALLGIEAIAVAVRPRPVVGSYMPCFLAGKSAAVAAGRLSGLPLFETSHQQGHMASALFGAGLLHGFSSRQNMFMLHCSGGTTELLLAKGLYTFQVVGKTLDLYAGQAIDRLGVQLGYDFPAGEALSQLAMQCNEKQSTKVSMEGANCHLSGLQNQCGALLKRGKEPAYVAKYCLMVVAQTMLGMIRQARKQYGSLPVLCAGGVMSSVVIRREMEKQETDLYFVPPEFSSDNAVGVAYMAGREEELGGNFRSIGTE